MTQPTRTPNPATSTRPERSSKRVAHKKPLAWLPLLLLALLALLALLVFLLVRHAADSDDGASSSPSGSTSTGPSSAGTGPTGTSGTSGTAGTGTAGTAFSAGAGALAGALIGGNGIAPVPATNVGTAPSGVPSAGSSTGSGSTGSGSAAASAAANSAAGTAGTVLFGSDEATPDSAGQQVIRAAAQALRASGATTVEVRGYTDVVAGAPVNDALSLQRATNVATALRALLPGVTVTPVAKGKADPVATNDTADGRQQNRRVVIAGTA